MKTLSTGASADKFHPAGAMPRGLAWMATSLFGVAVFVTAGIPAELAFSFALLLSMGLALLASIRIGRMHAGASSQPSPVIEALAGAAMAALVMTGSLSIAGPLAGVLLFFLLMTGEALASALVCHVLPASQSPLGGALAAASNLDGKYGGLTGRFL